ncbi:unnamed protein product [Notodromas monacha]|uniref:FLYWCH-type domain-containing protein n=1 Tax=Notodromas monacha TaxID=399045 RepID=A0A7R9BMK3_9CRUS|nr:unnamed protein product [Notodromas monacha]CAG0918267.1 unnamed protein product [Notodromas monacha]
MEVLINNKNNPQLHYRGYFYNFDKPRKDGMGWRCYRKGCKGRLKSGLDYKTGEIPVIVEEHSHAVEPEKFGAKKALISMKANVVTTAITTRKAIEEGFRDADAETLLEGGTRKAVFRRLNYTRRQALRRDMNHLDRNKTVLALQAEKNHSGKNLERVQSGEKSIEVRTPTARNKVIQNTVANHNEQSSHGYKTHLEFLRDVSHHVSFSATIRAKKSQKDVGKPLDLSTRMGAGIEQDKMDTTSLENLSLSC